MPGGGLDGLLAFPDGTLMVSSWGARAVYQVGPDAQVVPLLERVRSPADFAFDPRRGHLLIPVFEENRILIHPFHTPSQETQDE